MNTKSLFGWMLILVLSFSACGINHKNAGSNDNPVPVITTDTLHNSRNSLDYEGTYTGTIPCADCAGIDLELTLRGDDYTLRTVYRGNEMQGDNSFTETGKYTWNTTGSIITLNNDINRQYQVGENVLIALDQHGQPIISDLADMYVLRKR